MTYAYIIVIYVTYIQVYYYYLLGHGLPKDLWGGGGGDFCTLRFS